MSNEWKPTKLTVKGTPLDEGGVLTWPNLEVSLDDENVNRLVTHLTIECLPNQAVIAHIGFVLSELEIENLPVEIRASIEK